MRLECPHCHALFEVPDALVSGARRLRCANCGERWELGQAESTIDLEALAVEPERAAEDEDAPPVTQTPVFSIGEEKAAAPEVRRMAGRMPMQGSARRGAVLHSRSVGGLPASALADGQALIGTPKLWAAAWGASVAVVAAGGGAVWHWKLFDGASKFPAIAHLFSL